MIDIVQVQHFFGYTKNNKRSNLVKIKKRIKSKQQIRNKKKLNK